MAGGEFRFGTASMYMAEHEHIWRQSTSIKKDITWLRFRRPLPMLRVPYTNVPQTHKEARLEHAYFPNLPLCIFPTLSNCHAGPYDRDQADIR
jgi:hypothetical protein